MPSGVGDLLSPSETEHDLVNFDHHVKAELGAAREPVAELPNVTMLLRMDVTVFVVAHQSLVAN